MVEELRKDESMCKALLEIMEPEIKKEKILAVIEILIEIGKDEEEIKKTLMHKYDMNEVEIKSYL